MADQLQVGMTFEKTITVTEVAHRPALGRAGDRRVLDPRARPVRRDLRPGGGAAVSAARPGYGGHQGGHQASGRDPDRDAGHRQVHAGGDRPTEAGVQVRGPRRAGQGERRSSRALHRGQGQAAAALEGEAGSVEAARVIADGVCRRRRDGIRGRVTGAGLLPSCPDISRRRLDGQRPGIDSPGVVVPEEDYTDLWVPSQKGVFFDCLH